MGNDPATPEPANLDAVVHEVAAEAHVRLEPLRPEERAYLKEHALKKPLRVLDIWALGVGVVITGEYFGWNLGLKDNGPVAMLVASLIVGSREDGRSVGYRKCTVATGRNPLGGRTDTTTYARRR